MTIRSEICLFNVTNAVTGDDRGVDTILNDDPRSASGRVPQAHHRRVGPRARRTRRCVKPTVCQRSVSRSA